MTLHEVVDHANARRRKALEIEQAQLKPLPSRRTDGSRGGLVIVTRSSGFFLRHIFYTVPSRLIVHRLRVRLYDERLECLLGGTLMLTLPALVHSKGPGVVDAATCLIIVTLSMPCAAKKPMALLNLVCRDQLFPRDVFRHAGDRLVARQSSRNACRTMVGPRRWRTIAPARPTGDRASEGEIGVIGQWVVKVCSYIY